MKKLIDMTGFLFTNLFVIEQKGNTKGGAAIWKCECVCGNIKYIIGTDLRNGKIKSCGCLKKERLAKLNKTHGKSSTSKLYSIWKGMRSRCANKNKKYYGAKGISVCKEWDSFEAFENWSINNGYIDGLSIERKDNSKGYEPENCTWLALNKQAENRCNVLKNESGVLWLHVARENGIKDSTFRRRIFDGWSCEDASSRPMNKRKNERKRDSLGRYN